MLGKIKEIFIRFNRRFGKLNKKEAFVLGFLTATFLFVSAITVYSLLSRAKMITLSETSNVAPPAPRISSVVSLADEIIIKGIKFSSKGKLCINLSKSEECSQIEVISWGSSSIRAKFSKQPTGSAEVWVVTGENLQSNKFSF